MAWLCAYNPVLCVVVGYTGTQGAIGARLETEAKTLLHPLPLTGLCFALNHVSRSGEIRLSVRVIGNGQISSHWRVHVGQNGIGQPTLIFSCRLTHSNSQSCDVPHLLCVILADFQLFLHYQASTATKCRPGQGQRRSMAPIRVRCGYSRFQVSPTL